MIAPRALTATVAATAVLQAAIWAGSARGWLTPGQTTALHLVTTWAAIFILALAATRGIERLRAELRQRRDQHEATLSEVEQLGALNEMLVTAGKSKDVGLAFQALARRVDRLIRCDRLGLALVRDGGQELQLFSARVAEPERRRRPRPELQFSLERTMFGQVIRTCEPVLVEDLSAFASDFHDASVLSSQGFSSMLILPLVSRNRAIGALTVISRRLAAFTPAHRDLLQPLAEVLAFAFVVEQQYLALDRFKTMEAAAEMTMAAASDINSALQAIAGECGVMQTRHPETRADIEVVVRQTERIAGLLDRIRAAADERLREVATIAGSIPASPEAFAHEDDGV